MNKQELARLRFNLVSAVTEYDRRQSTKPSYNMYALPQYLGRVSEIMDDIAAGADPRAAITAGFTGTLLSSILRRLKMSGASMSEVSGMGSMVYEPVAKRNPRSSRGVYATFDSWRAAAKKAGAVRFEGGRDDIAQAWDATGSWVGEWDGAEGFVNKPKTKENPVRPRRGESEREFVSRCMSEEKKKFPEPKQRIAVCLSKARRNPFPDRNLDE